jgi:ribosomal-protein-alanine N-acetyltransferase
MENYQILTKHLGMRFIRKEDSKYLEHIDKDPRVKEYFPEGTLSDQQIRDFINQSILNGQKKRLPCLVIFKLNNNDFVGEAYFNQLETGEIKVGYLFHKKFWNKGYATEVLRAMLEWAKNNINTEYIIAYADKENTASFRVMEKCGMKYYKDGKHKDMECHFYRIKNK